MKVLYNKPRVLELAITTQTTLTPKLHNIHKQKKRYSMYIDVYICIQMMAEHKLSTRKALSSILTSLKVNKSKESYNFYKANNGAYLNKL